MPDAIQDLQFQLQKMQDKMRVIEMERGTIPRALSPFQAKTNARARTFAGTWTPQALFGIHMAICVDTRDPWKMGRIMVYCPVVHSLKGAILMTESSLPWAMPCSSFGSLDDMGGVFVPPEGSTVLIMFEGGNRESMFYVGSTWLPRRLSVATSAKDFTPQREMVRWGGEGGGKRASDVRSPQLPDHLLPPWNNESYFGNDLKPTAEFVIKADYKQEFK